MRAPGVLLFHTLQVCSIQQVRHLSKPLVLCNGQWGDTGETNLERPPVFPACSDLYSFEKMISEQYPLRCESRPSAHGRIQPPYPETT